MTSDAADACERQLAAFAAVDTALAELRELTVPSATLGAAATTLGRVSIFERVLLSSVLDGAMTAEAAWFRNDQRAGRRAVEQMREAPVRLTHAHAEAEVVRRRRAILVAHASDDRRAHAATLDAMAWDGYVAAPVVAGGAVIAILHADHAGRAVEAVDRDLLWSFADGLGRAFEIATLRRTLRRERRALRTLLDWLDDRSRETADVPIRLAATVVDLTEPTADETPTTAPGGVDTLVFDGLLTRRELEVLRLLSGGRTNQVIADELVVSIGTVKFHVNRVLGKLHVANRAEAVARYYALVGAPARG